MKRLSAAAALLIMSLGIAFGEEPPPISSAQFQKLQKFLDTIGAKEELPAPTAQNLGFSNDATKALPVVSVVTDDHKVYFCRSELNPKDYVVWVRSPDNKASYMFATHSDFKLLRAIYLRSDTFPQPETVTSPQARAIYRDALAALAKDLDKSAPR
jgi:hypothetical protein